MEIKNRLKRVRYKLRFCSKTLAAKDLDQIISDNQASKTKNMKKYSHITLLLLDYKYQYK